jgi:F-type H+-transporting ATPase subunit b
LFPAAALRPEISFEGFFMFVTEAFAEEAKPAAGAEGTDGHAAPAAAGDATHSEVGVAHEGEHGGAFPPFDSSTYASQLLWLALTFGFFYWFLKKVILPRLAGILSTRESRIAKDLADAEKMKLEADASVAAYEQELASAKAKSADIAAKAANAAKEDAAAKRKSAEASLDRKLAEAEGKIEAIKASGMKEVGRIAEDTAAAIIKQLTGASISGSEVASAVKLVKG